MNLTFNPKNFIQTSIKQLREEVPHGKVMVAVSGGVDSTTTAMLGHMALGEKIQAVFLDDGLMRKGEANSVASMLKKVGIKIKCYDVGKNFFKALKGMVDPELKRKAFRKTFYESLSVIAQDIGAKNLLQGTIAADIVETKQGVKTQHNVLSQIGIDTFTEYGLNLIEPLSTLYKDQVRVVAKTLKLPIELIERRPFPGPALAIRVLGEVTPKKIETVREATTIVEEETKNMRCFQSFAVLMNDRATGLSEGGKRKYGQIIVIRIVNSTNAIVATPAKIQWNILQEITKRIINCQPSVTRVLFDLTGKPPATIEFE